MTSTPGRPHPGPLPAGEGGLQTFAIIPAAGRSRRMGRPKLLLPWGERTIIEHVVDVWRASQVGHVVLIVHPQDDQVADLGRRAGAIVVQPAVAPAEMKVSVRLGLEYIAASLNPRPSDAWLLAPADMPGLATATIDRLIVAYRASVDRGAATSSIVAASVGGRRGHPVLFPWRLAGEIERLAADEGLNVLLARNPFETVDAGEAAVLEDLDTPEDYERLRARHNP